MAEYTEADLPLVRDALDLQRRGESLSREDKRAILRWERHDEELTRWKVYEAIPKKDFVKMYGTQHKVIDEQAERYKLAMAGPVVNLPAFLASVHDFLTRHALAFRRATDDEESMIAGAGANSPAAERYRGFKADLAHMDVEARKGELLPRESCRVGMLRIASRLRGAVEHLERRFGVEAREIVEQAIDEAAVDIDTLFPESETKGA